MAGPFFVDAGAELQDAANAAFSDLAHCRSGYFGFRDDENGLQRVPDLAALRPPLRRGFRDAGRPAKGSPPPLLGEIEGPCSACIFCVAAAVSASFSRPFGGRSR